MIWGASGGIGRALMRELKAEGWTVVAASRHDDETAEDADVNLRADVADSFSVQRAVMTAGQEVGAVDLWIYAAGDITSQPAADMAPEAWGRILGANLTGAYLTAHHSQPLLAPDAHLIFIGAVQERLRLPGLSAYAAAKAGLEAFAEALRKEQRGRKVTVVRPVAVDTPLWDKVPMRLPKDAGTPAQAATRILDVYRAGTTGIYDFHQEGA
jgi:NAD(P)-dependent dehydrogenase (short-subunit alcohol dehydrogenase family)